MLAEEFVALGVEIIAVSGDEHLKAVAFAAEMEVTFPIGYYLIIAQITALGLYITDLLTREPDRRFQNQAFFDQ